MTLKIKAELQLAKIDIKKYETAWKKQLNEATSAAAFQWIEEATSKIPIWSGASIATFSKLASALGVSLPGGTAQDVRSRRSLGEARSDGGVIKDKKGLIQGFFYETSLDHLVYNNFNNANASPDPTLFYRLLNPGPYNFVTAANDSAQKQFSRIVPPDVPLSIRKLRVK